MENRYTTTYCSDQCPVEVAKGRKFRLELTVNGEKIPNPTNAQVRLYARFCRNSLTQLQQTMHYYINMRSRKKPQWGSMLYHHNNKYTKKHYQFPFNTGVWNGGVRLS